MVEGVSAQPVPIIDQAYRSDRLDELEDALNAVVAPQRIVNASAGNRASAMLAFQGRPNLGAFQLSIGREVDINIVPEDTDDRIAFVRVGTGIGEVLVEGRPALCSPAHATIFTSGIQRLSHIGQDMTSRVFLASRAQITECCAKLLGHDIPGLVNFDISADLETPAGRSWLRLMTYAEAELADPRALIRHSPVAWRQFEQQLLTGFLLSLNHDYSQALLAPQAAAVPFYVKRAEAYIEAHYAEPLSLAEIAAQAGVSARSLQSGFQSFRNITPMGFVRAVRLRRAHEALLAAEPGSVKVSQVALACGFTHLGDFGTSYRRVFGVTPGQTLQKKRWF